MIIMTFVAAVRAKDGIAMVADSFATTQNNIVDIDDLADYIKKTKKTNINLKDLLDLFKAVPSHTRNYMDKLIEFDKWTGILTAGKAYINKKPIKKLINDIELATQTVNNFATLPVKERVDKIAELLKPEIEAHINDENDIGETTFIYAQYDHQNDKSYFYKIDINKTKKSDLLNPKHNLIDISDAPLLKVITDGQDKLIERLLYGSFFRMNRSAKVATALSILRLLKTRKNKRKEVIDLITNPNDDILFDLVKEDFRWLQLRELSLQEAIDFSALLVRIVMDIQMYTQNVPTVGGLIKLAVITKPNGFQWISGEKLITPKLVY